ncbi:3649_t:CDS:1 [Paraglomus occultum]|uniref:3649_t:CDS:1 n=1 Tax=Paraglomus occultum TaxID=144539 RepID=A0A9N9FUE8_9GLOM|nr:3649_t:CDS:1 [Paraglomus occultum]
MSTSQYVPIKPATPIGARSSSTESASSDLPLASLADSPLSSFERNLIRTPPYTLTLSPESLLDPTKKCRKNRVRKSTTPPRPQNAWVIFRKNFEGRLRAQDRNKTYTIQEISKMAGKDWKNQPMEVKQYFDALSKLAQQRHKMTYPDYSYKPKRNKTEKKQAGWSFKEISKEKLAGRRQNKVASPGEAEVGGNDGDARISVCDNVNEYDELAVDHVNIGEPYLDLHCENDKGVCIDNNINEYNLTDNSYNKITQFDDINITNTFDPFVSPQLNILHGNWNNSGNYDTSTIHNTTLFANITNITNNLSPENTYQTVSAGDHDFLNIPNNGPSTCYPATQMLIQLPPSAIICHTADHGYIEAPRWADGSGMYVNNGFDVYFGQTR